MVLITQMGDVVASTIWEVEKITSNRRAPSPNSKVLISKKSTADDWPCFNVMGHD